MSHYTAGKEIEGRKRSTSKDNGRVKKRGDKDRERKKRHDRKRDKEE